MLRNSFNGKKLEEARKIRNMTLQEVSDLAGITHQSISKYEKNRATPSPEMIQTLSNILNFEVSFFYRDAINETIFENAFIYRSKASVAKKYKDQTENQIGLITLLVDYIKNKINLPTFDTSLFKSHGNDFTPTSDEEIEDLAISIRQKFGLSDGPIGNITALCEKLGVYIFYLNLNHQGIDACSVTINGTPYIILNKDISSAARARFNIAHELGHILLHSNYPKKTLSKTIHMKRMEYEANRFAAAFTLPESGISKDLTSIGLDYLIILKKHWKISIQAIIYRAEQLELFTPEYCLYLRQQISRKKWRVQEPLDNEIALEQPKLFSLALQYLIQKMNMSMSQISFDTGIPESELLEYCYVTESDRNLTSISNKPPLKIIK